MDAFEALIAEVLEARGYWVRKSMKVTLTRDEKLRINRPSCPRWEIDLVAYRPKDNEVLAVECKSYIDSRGVHLADLQGGKYAARYKLFTEQDLRVVVLNRLALEMHALGLTVDIPEVKLALAAGNISSDPEEMRRHFTQKGWRLFDPLWLHGELETLSKDGYANSVASMVSKLVLRNKTSAK
jgi:hypothetical protein